MTDVKAVLALDPGKTTGWAQFILDGQSYQCGQTTFTETCAMIEEQTGGWGDRLLLVSESFIINMATVKNTQAPWSLELIGVARYFAMTRCHRDLALQMPSSAKGFASDDRLRKLGWYVPGQGHAMDAARHLILALATRKLIDTETILGMV